MRTLGAIDLAMEPGNPKNMYAALLQTRRPPWSIYPPSKGPGTGLYRSKDGGEHWEQLTGHGLPSEELGRMGIAFAPSNPKRIYLIADAKEGGLYRSDDGGENWARVSKDARIWGRGWYFCEVSVDSKDPDTVYVPNTSTYRSHDGGKTFHGDQGRAGRRRLSPALDRSGQPAANDFGMRSRRDRDAERRGDVEFLVQPGDRAVLSRGDGQSISVLGVWSAAG